MTATPKITALRGGHVTLAAAADAFLATPRAANPNTHRAYASAIDRTIALLGRDRLLAEVSDAEIGAALTELWGSSAPATWNRNRAAITSWLAWVPDQEALGRPVSPSRRRTPQGKRRRDPCGCQDRHPPAAVTPRHPAAGEDAVADAL
ncbi:hypothetical protein ACFSKW_12300 [Nonomuraea mangrovi]|uniref:Core-binding (CB) domain-containing protein n=1 Tax=Nonomuraea mangrovi TaxID=2316207 RepID=A0ABW4SSU0_9ACTN